MMIRRLHKLMSRLSPRAWILVIHSGIALQTAVRIEVLCILSDMTLPRSPEVNEYTPKWRELPWTTPEQWHAMFGPKDAKGQPVTRPLTPAETERMTTGVYRAKQRNRLRDVVETWGLAQYGLVPILIGISLMVWKRAAKPAQDVHAVRVDQVMAIVGMSIGVGCGGLMLYRGYFSSLGY